MVIVKFLKKGRMVNVFFDNGESIKIHYEVLCQTDLRLEQTISEKGKKEIIDKEELFSAKETALRILSRRIHSEKEVRQKLQKKDISLKAVNQVIEFLTDRQYLNDNLFTERFVEERFFHKKYGFNRIKNELRLKGVSTSVIDSVLTAYKSENSEIDIAVQKAEKKLQYYKRMKKYDQFTLKQKLTSFLVNRGFSFETARVVNSKFNFED